MLFVFAGRLAFALLFVFSVVRPFVLALTDLLLEFEFRFALTFARELLLFPFAFLFVFLGRFDLLSFWFVSAP